MPPSPSSPPQGSRRPRWIAPVLAGVVVVVLLELASAIVIAMVGPRLSEPIWRTRRFFRLQSARIDEFMATDSSALQFDSILGWRPRIGHHTDETSIVPPGLRSRRPYAARPAERTLRVAAFGDSFVYANEVSLEDGWASQIEQRDPRIEILNYGVGGYGGDQAALRFFLEGTDLAPRVVLYGFATDDMSRLVNVFRPFRSVHEWPLVKPRFQMDDGSLTLLPAPIAHVQDYARFRDAPERLVELGADDYWYSRLIFGNPLHDHSAFVRLVSHLSTRVYRRFIDPDRIFLVDGFNPRAEAFHIQMRLFQEFVDTAQVRNVIPMILLFPDRASMERMARGEPSLHAPLIAALDSAQLPYVDLGEAFAGVGFGEGVARWFMPGLHYSPDGNRVIADHLRRILAPHLPS